VDAWQYFIDSNRVLVFVGVQGLIAASNAALVRTLGSYSAARSRPRVSVLVPARDEAETVGACVESLLTQDYPDFEVLVLDDGSMDCTRQVLASIQDKRLRVLDGRPLPEGWTGKAWACQQLADAAGGDALLFTDADTVHQPGSVQHAVNAQEATGADLVTAISRNEVKTLGEQLTVPFVVWAIASLLPVAVGYLFRRSGTFSAGNGKFMLFRRVGYEAIGGHAAVRDDAADDLALCRLVKQKGLRWRLLDACPDVSARMYHGFGEAVDGFTKNLFALFGYRVLVALFVWFWLILVTWHPIVTASVLAGLHDFGAQFVVSLVTIAVAAGTWLLISLKFRMPWYLFVFHPVTMTIAAWVGLRSMVFTIAGRTRWKDRVLVKRKVRII
jgi:chlorobactene glucosyltransferase